MYWQGLISEFAVYVFQPTGAFLPGWFLRSDLRLWHRAAQSSQAAEHNRRAKRLYSDKRLSNVTVYKRLGQDGYCMHWRYEWTNYHARRMFSQNPAQIPSAQRQLVGFWCPRKLPSLVWLLVDKNRYVIESFSNTENTGKLKAQADIWSLSEVKT